LEAYASKTAIQREIEHQLSRGRKSAIVELMEGEAILKTKALKKAIELEDALVIEVLERAMTYLAAGVGALVNALNPQMVVIGGGVAEGIGAYLLPTLKAKMQRFVIPELLDTVTVTVSTLGDNAINYGALALILDSASPAFFA
jgi:glucokinase